MSGDKDFVTRIEACGYALDKYRNISLVLVGKLADIINYLPKKTKYKDRIKIVNADQAVDMADSPKAALKKNKTTSMWKALEMVKTGNCDVMVSAGNTAALVSFSKLNLGTITGVDKPAIAIKIPTLTGSALLLDAGGNIQCSGNQLYQFAKTGYYWHTLSTEVKNPKVALLNVGTEYHKGDQQIKLANEKLIQDRQINYIGYIEGNNILSGQADVIVCSGFHGNIALKTGEGVVNYMQRIMNSEFNKNFFNRMLWFFVKNILNNTCKIINPELLNGAVLLGLKGGVIKSHGDAGSEKFFHAIERAIEIAKLCCHMKEL